MFCLEGNCRALDAPQGRGNILIQQLEPPGRIEVNNFTTLCDPPRCNSIVTEHEYPNVPNWDSLAQMDRTFQFDKLEGLTRNNTKRCTINLVYYVILDYKSQYTYYLP